MATWREGLTEAFAKHGDTWENIEACTLSQVQLDREFDDDWGSAKGDPFTVWTKTRVYFPIVYDGAEWVGSVSRHPDGIATHHQGGQ